MIFYTNKINNCYHQIQQGKIGATDNGSFLHKTHTGLGNNLFEISTHIVFCLKINLPFCFPDIELLYNKIKDYPRNTIYRNLDIKPKKNMKKIYNIKWYLKNLDSHRKIILKIFSIDSNTKKKLDKKYLNKFRNKILVSLHVRRGDFVFIAKKWNPNYIVNNKIYAEKSINYIKTKLKTNFEILVFSDDIPWCQENLNFPNIHFISNDWDFEDLWLMSLCDHNIINSSTFSWWGAYLNPKYGKNIVVCPRKSIFKEKNNPDSYLDKFYPKYWKIMSDE